MPHTDEVAVPHCRGILARIGGGIAVVHPDAVAVGVARDLRDPDPDRGIAALVPLVDLVGQRRAVRGEEAQIRAVVLGLRVVDVARIEDDQHGEVGQRLGLREIVERQLLPTGPVGIPPVDAQRVVFVDSIGVVVGHRGGVVDGCHGDLEILPGDRVALTVVDLERERIAGGLGIVMDVDQTICCRCRPG